MKKLLVLVLVLTVSVFSLFAGGQQEGGAAAAEDETKVLRVTAANWILGKFPVEEAGKRFMKDHPNVKVEVTGFQDYSLNTMMLNWASGDINEDIGFGGTAGQVAKLAYKDLTASWNDFFTGEYAKDNFLSAVVELAKKDNQYYALPFMVEAMSLQANKGLMEDAGLVNGGEAMHPKSLEDLYTFAQKMTKGSGDVKDVYGFSWNFTNFGDLQLFCAINSLGGTPYNPDMSPNLDAPEIEDVFSFIKRATLDGYSTKGTITDTNAGRSGFNAGKVAMMFEAASRAIEAKPELGDDSIILPFPGMKDNGTLIYAHYTYIPKDTEVKDLAYQFMREQVLSDWFAGKGALEYGKMPSLKALFDGLGDDFVLIKDLMANPNTISDVSWIEGSKLNKLIYDLEQSLVTSDMTPAEAAKKLREEGSTMNLMPVGSK